MIKEESSTHGDRRRGRVLEGHRGRKRKRKEVSGRRGEATVRYSFLGLHQIPNFNKVPRVNSADP